MGENRMIQRFLPVDQVIRIRYSHLAASVLAGPHRRESTSNNARFCFSARIAPLSFNKHSSGLD
jgi:hypothetical protein